MNPGLRFAAAAAAVLLTACGVTRHRYAGFSPAATHDIVCVRPVAAMSLVVRGDDARPDPWFSRYMADRLQRSLQRQAPELHLQLRVADDSLRREELRREVERVASQLARKPAAGYAAAMPVLEDVIRSRPGRYALLTMCRGFMRTEDNALQQASRSAHRQIVFGPLLGGRGAEPSRFGLYALVYDRDEKRVVYFGRRISTPNNLLDDRAIDKQVKRLLGSEFKPRAAQPSLSTSTQSR
jgi:hypothetical protein